MRNLMKHHTRSPRALPYASGIRLQITLNRRSLSLKRSLEFVHLFRRIAFYFVIERIATFPFPRSPPRDVIKKRPEDVLCVLRTFSKCSSNCGYVSSWKRESICFVMSEGIVFFFRLGELWRRQDSARLRLPETAEAEGIERHTRRQFGASCYRGRTDSSHT